MDDIGSAPIGTMAWARATGGNLTTGERRRLLLTTMASVGPVLVDRVRAALGRRRGPLADDVVARILAVPDTSWVLAAAELAEAQGPVMLGHGMRTHLYGQLLHAGRAVDPASALDEIDVEALYVASLLHDLGLASPTEDVCFTVAGATAVLESAEAAGIDEGRAEATADAVVGHAQPDVSPDVHGRIAMLVQEGAVLDLAGSGRSEIAAVHVAEVVRRHPTLKAHRIMSDAWRDESRVVPRGRAAVLTTGGFPWVIRACPREMRG